MRRPRGIHSTPTRLRGGGNPGPCGFAERRLRGPDAGSRAPGLAGRSSAPPAYGQAGGAFAPLKQTWNLLKSMTSTSPSPSKSAAAHSAHGTGRSGPL